MNVGCERGRREGMAEGGCLGEESVRERMGAAGEGWTVCLSGRLVYSMYTCACGNLCVYGVCESFWSG